MPESHAHTCPHCGEQFSLCAPKETRFLQCPWCEARFTLKEPRRFATLLRWLFGKRRQEQGPHLEAEADPLRIGSKPLSPPPETELHLPPKPESEPRREPQQEPEFPQHEPHDEYSWISGDLRRLVGEARTTRDPVPRHFLLLQIVQLCYSRRSEPRYRALCREVAERHVSEFPIMAPLLKRKFYGLPRVSTFQHYATVLAEDGDYYEAIEVCKKAMSYGLSDGTQSGFWGRSERIKKEMKKEREEEEPKAEPRPRKRKKAKPE